jgi:flagellar biosynthetic protein FliQ
MNGQQVIDLFSQVVYASVEISAPLLLAAMFVGLVVSIFQAATQINESTLSFLPKVAAIILVLVLLAPWMLQKMTDYTHQFYGKIAHINKN